MAPLSCALCGPASLHASGGRSQEHECSAEQRGFSTADVDIYVFCQCCHAVVTMECIDRVVAGAGPPPNAACTEHDPFELWEIARSGAHRSPAGGRAFLNFKPRVNGERTPDSFKPSYIRIQHLTRAPHPLLQPERTSTRAGYAKIPRFLSASTLGRQFSRRRRRTSTLSTPASSRSTPPAQSTRRASARPRSSRSTF